jgi:alpha-mannosidase
MQKHLDLTRRRLRVFASESNLGGKFYTMHAPVKLNVYAAPDRITFAEALQGDYRPVEVGHQFGPLWSTHWVRVDIEIPEDWGGHEVHFLWDSSSEACIWQDGQPMQGLTGSSGGWAVWMIRGEYVLARPAQGGEKLTLYVEVACNGLFGTEGALRTPITIGLLRKAEIAVFDRQAWDLFWDFRVIADMAEELPANTPRGGQALFAANAMVNAINLDDRTTWSAARQIATEFYAARNGDGQHNLSAIGHAHIDTAWLWPLAETQRKCVRTFSTALRYMDDYPDYKFVCSQAQQYEWIKQMHPGLYAKIKARVAEGRFIPAGGSWVEPDCNIPSGEALVRQFLFGQRFFQQEFGITCHEFWEPDVFGYSAAVPQILQQAGIRYFLTQKLSWNQFNQLASHTFWWEGLDGSRVLVHFPPADTYNSMADVKEVLFNVSNFKDHEHSKESYLLFGFGDGGGGPSLPMLEQIARMSDVDGLPRVAIRSPEEFFSRCETDAHDLTTWVGELYFELHRGTYTTQALNKRYNRRSEFWLHDVEFLSAVASIKEGLSYPVDELRQLWKTVLTNQFHDILPGSSISAVYRDSTRDYQTVETRSAELRERALRALVGQTSQSVGNLCAVNTTGVPREEVMELPAGFPTTQAATNGKPLGIVHAPSYGYAVFEPQAEAKNPVHIVQTQEAILLENQFIRATFHPDGSLVSLYDERARQEAIQPGESANHFVIFDDVPNNNDAWDVDIFHLEKRYEVPDAHAMHIVEAGPLRAAIEFEYELSPHSHLKQTVLLTSVSPRLDFTNEVEWEEQHKFLKVEFPLNLRAQSATYEIQFGHLQRPTHFNTSWDMARFEVCAHKWADLGEPDFGVALLNDCKYGYSTQGNVMRLSLIRSPKSPDPQADMGHHEFRYALLPHAGSFQDAGVVAEGYRFNVPLQLLPVSAPTGEVSFFKVEPGSVILDTVKKAEDSDQLVVRLYEAHGSHSRARLSSNLPFNSVARCNLLEEQQEPLEWSDGGVELEFTPFQIMTLILK